MLIKTAISSKTTTQNRSHSPPTLTSRKRVYVVVPVGHSQPFSLTPTDPYYLPPSLTGSHEHARVPSEAQKKTIDKPFVPLYHEVSKFKHVLISN